MTPQQQIQMKNFDLDEDEFNQLVNTLKRGEDELFEKVQLFFFEYCVNFLKKEYGAKHEQAYSSTVNALFEAREELVKNTIERTQLREYILTKAVEKFSELNNSNQLKKVGEEAVPRNKNFGLSEEEFDNLVQELQNGNNQLFELIYLKHFGKCLNFLIKYRNATYENAYSSTMDALLEIRKDLIRGKIKYGNLAYYFTIRACRKLSKIRKKGNASMKLEVIEDKDFQDDFDLTKELENLEMATLIKKALDKLDDECRKILILYYYINLTWVEIATKFFPEASQEIIQTKANTLRRKTRRKCLTGFKKLLRGFLN